MDTGVKKMKLCEVEKAVDKAIPLVLIALAGLIIWGLFTDLHEFEPLISLIDSFIIAFLVIDLFFKWRHVRKLKKFLRLYWLDLLAVFPFYLLFRFYIFAIEAAKVGEEAQKVLHEALLLKETRIMAVERAAKEGRLISRIIRGVQRFVRLLVTEVHVIFGHFVGAHVKVQKKKV